MARRSKNSSLKGSTALSRAKGTASKSSRISNEDISSALQIGPLKPESPNIDPLKAVSDFPEAASDVPADGALSDSKAVDLVSEELHTPSQKGQTLTPWDYPANLFSLIEANATCISGFATQLSAANSATELLAATSELYAEQGRLLRKHSSDLLRMMALKN